MSINVEVSIGELLDKISILIIKEKNIRDEKKLSLVKNELNLLKKTIEKFESKSDLFTYIDKLVEINTKLWNIEDQIRDCERLKTFDQNFIDLARSVYITNDKRSEIKLEINEKFDSGIIEVKSYEKY
tara:strand:- start:654 stop:1037 length:384 start_codon:yes stop_codon:yes gene_type:complete